MRIFCVVVVLAVAGCAGEHRAKEVAFNPPDFPTGKTFHKDVEPILQNNCQKCHSTGGIGPIQLVDYNDVMQNASKVANEVYARRMPPWMPSDDCASLRDARTLTQDEIDTLVGWYLGGAVEGDPADAPPPYVPPAGLTDVSLAMKMPTAYTPNAALLDDYRCFVFDPQLASEKELIAFEIVPGDRREVHHVLLYEVDAAAVAGRDGEGGKPGYTCFGGPGVDQTQVVGAWAPGTTVMRFPTDTGILLSPGKAIVMQVHYNLGNGAYPDQTEIKYQFAAGPVKKQGQIMSSLNHDFVIPANSHGYSAAATRTVPANGTIWGMAPHMHTLGRDARVDLDGECLLHIPSWDFHWQDMYFSDQPTGIPVKKGQTVTFTCTWDNPQDHTVEWGESTTDEMCIAYYYVTPE